MENDIFADIKHLTYADTVDGWVRKIQKIKNYWDMEIIGNRRKMNIITFC